MSKTPDVRFKVRAKVTEENLRDYMFQRTYANAGIIIPYLFAAVFLYMAATTFGKADILQWSAYLLFGLLFAFGIPINIWNRCRRDLRRSKGLQQEVWYYLDDEGIYYAEGDRDVLEWDKIHHIVSTKLNVVIYATSKMAFFFPKDGIEDYEAVKEFIISKMKPGYAVFKK